MKRVSRRSSEDHHNISPKKRMTTRQDSKSHERHSSERGNQ